MLRHLRPSIRNLAGYIPGEQPRDDAYIKLNTNENPYPPSPRVLNALQAAAVGDRLRKYPDPLALAVRQAAARIHDCDPDAILVGNGSDDILTILARAFVPEGGWVVSPTPSYLLYRTLAELQGAKLKTVPFSPGWTLPTPWPCRDAHLTFVANPNSPSGTVVSSQSLALLAAELDAASAGPLVVDEAYVDFADADSSALTLARQGKVIVTRTLSKSYSLAGIRLGYAIADPAVIRELRKVKDSYNCDVLSLAAGLAALEDQTYLQETVAKVRVTRERLARGLTDLGFEVTPSCANFVWCRRRDRSVQPIYEELKRRRILVRYMNYPDYGDGLRISVGTDEEIDRLLGELADLLKSRETPGWPSTESEGNGVSPRE